MQINTFLKNPFKPKRKKLFYELFYFVNIWINVLLNLATILYSHLFYLFRTMKGTVSLRWFGVRTNVARDYSNATSPTTWTMNVTSGLRGVAIVASSSSMKLSRLVENKWTMPCIRLYNVVVQCILFLWIRS